jgi:hypothetical protein
MTTELTKQQTPKQHHQKPIGVKEFEAFQLKQKGSRKKVIQDSVQETRQHAD